MLYRKFGSLDWMVSALGFGTLRLPIVRGNYADIDEDRALRMIHRAVEGGINFFDSSYDAHGGIAEKMLGKAIRGKDRKKVRICTKLPSWLVEGQSDFDRFFFEQLNRLRADRVDFYLLHSMNRELWPRMRDLGFIKWAESKISKGLIGNIGFSFHDEYALFKEIIDFYDGWSMCMIQLNFMDADKQAGVKGLKYARSRGLAVAIMEPLRGGQLTKSPPPAIVKIWGSARIKRRPAEWALKWVWNHDSVSVALSGMSTMRQLEQNLKSAESSEPGSMSEADLALIDRVRKKYAQLIAVPCTGCRYCLPCPTGVNIPEIFDYYNDALMYNDPEKSQLFYRKLLADGERADMCIECGRCEERCPQGIKIIRNLKMAHKLLGNR